MLYIKDRKGSQKGGYSIILFLFSLLLLTGCNDNNSHKDRVITVEAFSDMKAPDFVYDLKEIRRHLKSLMNSDKGTTEADRQTRHYYQDSQHPMVWIDRLGVDERADSLLDWLHLLNEIGMSEKSFAVETIEQDIKRLRTLSFGEGQNSLNKTAARLEYHLTKACLRYCYGQRFGFINPNSVFNNLDVEKSDTVRKVVKYRGLFDIPIDRPGKNYASLVIDKVRHDSIAVYLREIQPDDKMYLKLKDMLPTATGVEQRKRILVNMERWRWRRKQPIVETGKRIIVNIPAYHLYAYSDDSLLDMRVVCGNVKTKTPQLSSHIEWMEVNPQWVMPMSIIENDVTRHVGDSSYFARNRYYIYDKETHQRLNVKSVTRQMLLSGKYKVAQEGGAGNSLGRIIFRFKNNFSVFLHDTSNPGAFERLSRAMSHGCVRVAKPFELARFVLDSPDEWLLDRIRIAMGLTPETLQGMEYVDSHPEVEDRNKIISYVSVKPRVPLYIIYSTLWPDEYGNFQTWPDVYGYDQVVWNHLSTYM